MPHRVSRERPREQRDFSFALKDERSVSHRGGGSGNRGGRCAPAEARRPGSPPIRYAGQNETGKDGQGWAPVTRGWACLSWRSLGAQAPWPHLLLPSLWPNSQGAGGRCSSSDHRTAVMSRAVLISNGSLKFWSRPSAHTAMSAEGGISRSQVRAGAPCRGAVLRAGFRRGAWTPVPCPPIPGPASLHLGSDTYRPRAYYVPWAGTKNMHAPVFVLRNWSQGWACRNTAVRSADCPAHRTLPSIATARGAGSSSRPWA